MTVTWTLVILFLITLNNFCDIPILLKSGKG